MGQPNELLEREVPDGDEAEGEVPEGHQLADTVELPDNIEELAAKARIKREERCSEEINAILEKHNCTLAIALQMGNQMVRLDSIVALPGTVQVIAKTG